MMIDRNPFPLIAKNRKLTFKVLFECKLCGDNGNSRNRRRSRLPVCARYLSVVGGGGLPRNFANLFLLVN